MMNRIFLPLLMVVILTGCSVFSKQHNEFYADYQQISSAEDAVKHAKKFKTNKKATRILHLQEQARLYHIAGDYALSRKKLAEALEFYRDSDYDAIINAARLGTKAAALVTNDKVIPYHGSDYERIYARQIQAMNYLALGDVNGAMVEIRAAANEQRFATEARAERVDDAVEKKRKKLMEFVDKEQLSALKTLAGDERNGFLNSYMYYFSALLREATGDSNGAYIDYQKAWQLAALNHYAGNHVVRLAEIYDAGNQPRYQELLAKSGSDSDTVPTLPAQSGRVAVLIERGFVQPRQELIFNVQFDYVSLTGQYRFVWSRAAIPYYNQDDFHFLSPVTVSSGDSEARSQLMMSSVTLAANKLQEAMPGIMFRQWARIISKHIVSDVVFQVMTSGGDEAGLVIGLATALAVKGVVILLEQADTRSWLSIPAQIDNAELILPAGKQEITVTLADGRIVTTQADVKAGGITIIRVFDNGIFANATQLYPTK
ncbi:MAG: hypothetical protein K0U39_02370 [Alphaproteobacteria bacterium]|nr:hypothetical protein [Alphaproteobacteria bacterium]